MDNKQTTTDHTRWEAMRKWPAASVRSSQGIPVEFALPPTAFAIDDPRAEGVVRWILEAKASLPGTDFAVIFPVDVRSAARSGPADASRPVAGRTRLSSAQAAA